MKMLEESKKDEIFEESIQNLKIEKQTIADKFLVPTNLPTFKIDKDSVNDAERFLLSVKRVLVAHGMDLDKNWFRILPICVKETVAIWIEQNLNSDQTWNQMSQMFIKQYTDIFHEQRFVKKLFMLKPNWNESTVEFCSRFELLANEAKVSETDKSVVHTLLEALPETLQWQLYAALINRSIQELSIPEICRSRKPKNVNNFHGNSSYSTFHNKNTVFSVGKKQYNNFSNHTPTKPGKSVENNVLGFTPHLNSKNTVQKSFSTGSKNSNSKKNYSPESVTVITRKGEKGHYANHCFKKIDTKQPKSEHTLVSDSNISPFLIPKRVKNQKTTALIDTGADVTFVNAQFCKENNIKILPIQGEIHTANPNFKIPRIGKTEKLNLVCKNINIKHECEVIVMSIEKNIIIGNDLIPNLKINIFGLPFEYPDLNDHSFPDIIDEKTNSVDVQKEEVKNGEKKNFGKEITEKQKILNEKIDFAAAIFYFQYFETINDQGNRTLAT
ncbi:hypothetical protein BB559_002938 [Furculomyces boomerangus]|uniref:Peptidase A2 domain-containing protein n=1 Tax=Furculomyces boomerangus TaxID=61424 RepID=A0A2T9YQX4_9FUNG|nr:hypothetical protein BB559_002938 [Furculomyces boomerangus]